MKTIAFSLLSLISASAALHAAEFRFNLGNSSHVNWDQDGIWKDASGNFYGSGISPDSGDTIGNLAYDSSQGVGLPNLYLNGDRAIRVLEGTNTADAYIRSGWRNSTGVENTLAITESFNMKAGAYYFFGGTNGKLTVETPNLVMGSPEYYPANFSYIQLGSTGQGNIHFTSQQTLLGGYSSNITFSSGFDALKGNVNLGHVLFDMTPGIAPTPWPGVAGINLQNINATLNVASLRGGDAENRGSIRGTTGTVLINSANSSIALTEIADFNRSIEGGLKVIKEGSALQIFSYANTYTGGSTISEGVLSVRNTTGSGLGTGAVRIEENGTLAGQGVVALSSGNTISVETGGVIAPGADNQMLVTAGLEGNSFQTLMIEGTKVEMKEGAAFGFRLDASGGSDKLSLEEYVNGNLLLEGGEIAVNVTGALSEGVTYILFNFSSGTSPISSGITEGLVAGSGFDGYLATFHYDQLQFGGIGTISMTVAAIPEPNISLLTIPAISGLLLWKRGRGKKK